MKISTRNVAARVSAALLAITTFSALADDAKPDVKDQPKKKWESVATAGVTLTRGNSRTFLGTVGLNTKRSWTNNEVLAGATGGYGTTTTTVGGVKTDTITDSYAKGFGQWNHLFTPQAYGGLRLDLEHDDVASLAYRARLSPLIGYYFIKTNDTTLAGEIGPSLIREKFFHQSVQDYLGLRIAERGEHKFHSGAKVWESVEWTPKVDDMQNYLVNFEAGISAPINKSLSLSLVLQDWYKSVPATGKLKNDLKLIAGLSYNF